jgi:hypothetical protein
LIILFYLFVVRPILNWLKKEVEPVGFGAEQAVLPDYPMGSGPGDSLPLPLPPRELPPEPALTETMSQTAAGAATDSNLPQEVDDVDGYDDEEPEEVEESPQELGYGQLTREKMMPLARENMERTVGLLRNWIEQKPQQDIAQER